MAICQVLSCLIDVVGGGTFPGEAKPLALDIWWGVDRLGTCVTESYME
jgi:hypothetical protein